MKKDANPRSTPRADCSAIRPRPASGNLCRAAGKSRIPASFPAISQCGRGVKKSNFGGGAPSPHVDFIAAQMWPPARTVRRLGTVSMKSRGGPRPTLGRSCHLDRRDVASFPATTAEASLARRLPGRISSLAWFALAFSRSAGGCASRRSVWSARGNHRNQERLRRDFAAIFASPVFRENKPMSCRGERNTPKTSERDA